MRVYQGFQDSEKLLQNERMGEPVGSAYSEVRMTANAGSQQERNAC
jgi:hypothetical protein